MQTDFSRKRVVSIFEVIDQYEQESYPPLSIYFNLLDEQGNQICWNIGINTDGETIFFKKYQRLYNIQSISEEIDYGRVIPVENNNELYQLVNQRVENVSFGNGKATSFDNSGKAFEHDALFYFLLKTKNNHFLFFNNGDEGFYTFHEIEKILQQDIYGYKWESIPPLNMNINE